MNLCRMCLSVNTSAGPLPAPGHQHAFCESMIGLGLTVLSINLTSDLHSGLAG